MGVEIRLPKQPDWGNPHLFSYEQAELLYRNATVDLAASHSGGRTCYLATPYSNACRAPDGDWMQLQSLDCQAHASRWCRLFAERQVTAIAPVVLTVDMIHVDFDEWLDPLDDRFWSDWRQPLLNECGSVAVPPIPGWQESDEVWSAVCFALRSARSVFLLAESEAADLAWWLDE